jgi:hypothetical protein
MIRESGLASFDMILRLQSAASITVVPLPLNGSYTTSRFLVKRSMKKRGSWGLKQALYEISWIDAASRCPDVQNSLI